MRPLRPLLDELLRFMEILNALPQLKNLRFELRVQLDGPFRFSQILVFEPLDRRVRLRRFRRRQ